jgi:WD40 repeat protein
MMIRHRRLFTLIAILTISASTAAPAGVRTPSVLAKGDDVASTWLYQLESRYGRTLMPLNPLTLQDMPTAIGVPLGSVTAPNPHAWMLTSADGSTVASVSYLGGNATTDTRARDITVRVFDEATGFERAHFHPSVPILTQGLSPDGSQLSGPRLTPVGSGDSLHRVWCAVSTRTGRTVRTVQMVDADAWPAAYDFSGQRLYALDVHPFNSQTHRPQTPAVLAYDVRSGRQIGVLNLQGVLAGSGLTDREVNGRRVYAEWSPGLALSPDSRRLALLDGNTETLDLIDTASLKVVRTEAVTHPASLIERFGAWLGIVPQVALAKGGEGVVLTVRFSPDGTRLYVWGRRGSFDAAGSFIYQSLDLEVVRVDGGQILAETQKTMQTMPLGFSPDGSALYTLSASADLQGWVLRRVDPVTLKVAAERTFLSYPQLFLLPAT